MNELNTIVIPEDLNYSRDIQYASCNFSREDLVDDENYDLKTLVYDIFLTTCNEFLIIISPPWLNLNKIFLPLKINFLGNEVLVDEKGIYRYCYNNVTIVKIPIKKKNVKLMNSIRIKFNNFFEWEGMVSKNTFLNKGRVLVTMQKDNKIEWIKGFVDYYKREYNISDVIIYDNNSSIYPKGVKEIRGLDKSVLVIEWNFPYGSSKNDWDITSSLNHFSQVGSLNHARLKYGSDQLMFNFDIDELLHTNSRSIVDSTETITSFRPILVPNILPSTVKYPDVSFEDYLYQDIGEKDPEHYYASKYVFRPCSVDYCDVHLAKEKTKSSLHKLTKYKLFRELVRMLMGKKFLNEVNRAKEGRRCSIKDGYYLHYVGINTGWMYPDRTVQVKFDELKHKRIDLWTN